MQKSDMTGELIEAPKNREITRLAIAGLGMVEVPAVIAAGGAELASRYLEFFAGSIRNPNTRAAYLNAVTRFCDWMEAIGLADLAAVQPLHVATYVEALGKTHGKASVGQHLSALKSFFAFLVAGGTLKRSPAVEVKAPTFSRRRGATPITSGSEVRRLMDAIPTDSLVGLRDRALIATLLYTMARVSAALHCQVKDYYAEGFTRWLCLHEKGGKEHRMPVHHQLVEYLETYLDAAGIRDKPGSPLFRSALGRTGQLTELALDRRNALAMIKRRAAQAGISPALSPHSFRAMAITFYLENGGTLEEAREMANHADTRTTKLYDRTERVITQSAVERIRV